jgi:transposase
VRCRKNRLPDGGGRILLGALIGGGFLTAEERQALTELARDGLAEHRLARRANALVLLDRGMSCEEVGRVLLIDDDTIRPWHRLFEKDGVDGLAGFNYGGRTRSLSLEQQATLKAWVGETLPQTTREVGAWIEHAFGVVYESRSGLIALLHRLGLEHRKPQAVSRKLDPARQKAFIDAYEGLLKTLPDDEAVMFADAVHPTHGARPVGCWAPKEVKVGMDQTSGRERLNLHGALDLETGRTRMIEVLTVDALSTIALLVAIEAVYPAMRIIHVFLDNARYHHAKAVQDWLAMPGRRIRLHFVPAYCPHLNPIERLWALRHKTVTHNRCHATYNEFCDAVLGFLRHDVSSRWNTFCDSVTDNFRIISPEDFRVLR